MKKNIKIIISLFLVLIFSTSVFAVESKDDDIIDKIKSMKMLAECSIDTGIEDMDTIQFGAYCQKKDQYGIYTKTAIDWILIYRDDDNALLMSKYILDCRVYNDKEVIKKDGDFMVNSTNKYASDWKYSTLRAWMNDYMYKEMFNDEEKKLMNEAYLDNTYIYDYEHHTVKGNYTKDNVFLLNENEIFHFLGKSYKEDKDKIKKIKATKATEYATKYRRLPVNNADGWDKGNSAYLMRSVNIGDEYVSVIKSDGNYRGKVSINEEPSGIRPCIFIKLKETNDMARIDLSKEVRNDKEETISKADTFEKVMMGRWNKKEDWYDLEWYVLKEENDKALVFCKNVVDSKPYYKEKSDRALWQNSDVRKYLNEDFYKIAFSETEKAKIIDTNIKVNNNIYVESKEESYILDKIFLLSYDELVEYIGLNDRELLSARRLGEATVGRRWFTRTIGEKSNTLITVDSIGRITMNTKDTFAGYLRPAMWIKIN